MLRISRRSRATALGIAALMVAGTFSASANPSDPASPADLQALVESGRTADSTPIVEHFSGGGVSNVTRLETATSQARTLAGVPEDSCSTDASGQELCVTYGGALSPEEAKAAERALAAKGKVEARKAGPSAKALEGPATTAAAALPQWCLERGVANIMYYTRNQACGIFGGVLTVRRTINNVPTVVGFMNFLVYRHVYTVQSMSTVWESDVEVSPTLISGEAAGTAISGLASCTGSACVPIRQAFAPQTPGVNGSASGVSLFEWPPTPGGVGEGTPSWRIIFKTPTAPAPATLDFADGPAVRCDQAVSGSASIGCVFPGARPELIYYITDFPTYGTHLKLAEISGLPGSWYSKKPLHRMTDAASVTANRNLACPSSLPRPSGFSCDEYPFASTREGASTGGGVGGRTFEHCQIATLPQGVTGPGYSACMINAAENTRAGSWLQSKLYVPSRVLDGDAYFVTIE